MIFAGLYEALGRLELWAAEKVGGVATWLRIRSARHIGKGVKPQGELFP